MAAPSSLTAFQLARFCHLCFDATDYAALPQADKDEISMILDLAVSYCGSYAGLDMTEDQPDALRYAVLAVGAEMYENRQMTQQYSTQNPTVMQILDMYSTNLLPTVSDPDTSSAPSGDASLGEGGNGGE